MSLRGLMVGWLVGICLGAGVCLGQAANEPDVMVFTNGDQLKGTLMRGVGTTIVFKSEMVGEITVGLDKVKELRTAGSFAVLKKDVPLDRQRVEPGRVVVARGGVSVSGRAALAGNELGYMVDAATYEKEVAVRPRPLEGWDGSVTAGVTLERSTQNGATYTAGVALVRNVPVVSYLAPRNRTRVDFTETYGKITQPVIPQTNPASPDSVAKTNIFHADVERDEYASPHFYGLAQAAFDHNFSQGLDLQELYGAGVGWTPVQRAAQQLDLKVDAHYEKQEFETVASNQNLIGSTFSEAYRRALPRKMVLTQTLNLLPAWNNLNAYAGNGSVVLAAPLLRRLTMTVTATDSYLNNPSAGFQKNSFQFVTGVSYALR